LLYFLHRTLELCGGETPSARVKSYALFSLPFQYSGSLLSCITAMINISSPGAWYITPYGKRFVKHLLVFTDSDAHASGNERMFCMYGRFLLQIPDRDHADNRYNNQQRRLILFQQQDGKNISSV
jgi:hypothetical protein